MSSRLRISTPRSSGAGNWRTFSHPCPSRSVRFSTEGTGMPVRATAEIERVFRHEYGRAVAVLVRVCGDIDAAEEAVQDAFAVAVHRWPIDGVPPSPVGWIITTARRRTI